MSDTAIAVHPDFSTNTLVILGSRDVLLIRDYVKFLRSWERHKEKVGSANALSKSYYSLADESASDLKPDMFASFTSSNKRRYASDYLQLAVADGRAICFRVRDTWSALARVQDSSAHFLNIVGAARTHRSRLGKLPSSRRPHRSSPKSFIKYSRRRSCWLYSL